MKFKVTFIDDEGKNNKIIEVASEIENIYKCALLSIPSGSVLLGIHLHKDSECCKSCGSYDVTEGRASWHCNNCNRGGRY